MSETPKNQPTFHINQVGNLNTGDVTNARDQVGFQYNYTFPDPKQAEATQIVADLLKDIRNHHPQATDAEIIEICDRGLTTMQHNNPQKWRKWVDILSVVFAGGVEAVKIVAPALGIPIEIGRRLYEIWDRNRLVSRNLIVPPTDPDDDPDELILESLRISLQQVSEGKVHPIAELWEGIDA